MILLIDGFDHYAAGDYSKKGWSAAFGSMQTGRFGSGQALATQTPIRRALNATSGSTVFMQSGFYASASSAPVIVLQGFDVSTVQFTLLFDHMSGTFRVYRGDTIGTLIATSSAVSLVPGTWQFIEIKVGLSPAAGLVTLKFNGVTVLTATGLNTMITANAYITQAGFGGTSTSGNSVDRWDDFAVFDSSGTLNNDFMGDCRVSTLYPTNDGATLNFTPSAGTLHYVTVDETTPNNLDYVWSATLNNIDTFGFSHIPTNAVVKAVQVNLCASKDDAGPREIGAVIRSGVTNYAGVSKALGVSESFLSQTYEVNPATGIAFAAAEVNACEYGIKVTL